MAGPRTKGDGAIIDPHMKCQTYVFFFFKTATTSIDLHRRDNLCPSTSLGMTTEGLNQPSPPRSSGAPERALRDPATGEP